MADDDTASTVSDLSMGDKFSYTLLPRRRSLPVVAAAPPPPPAAAAAAHADPHTSPSAQAAATAAMVARRKRSAVALGVSPVRPVVDAVRNSRPLRTTILYDLHGSDRVELTTSF